MLRSSYYKIPITGLIIFLFFGCQRNIENTISISGEAQGTSYHITYLAGEHSNYRQSFDSLFRHIDLSLSTYDSTSLVSKINRNNSTVTVDRYFLDVFNKSIEVSEKTKGLFDITVAPVINAYGFGFTKRQRVTKVLIDSLIRFVGYKKLSLANNKVVKEMPQVMLDFNAIAQGYTVDVLASFLEDKGIKNYMVEVGGELRAKGTKLNDSSWTVGIQIPSEDEAEAESLFARVRIRVNTFFGYLRQLQKVLRGGRKKISHIINPFTGYPAKSKFIECYRNCQRLYDSRCVRYFIYGDGPGKVETVFAGK